VHVPYPASQRLRHVDANASTLRILPSIRAAAIFRPDEIQGIGRRLMKRSGVPAVLQKHILSDRFVTPTKRRWPQNISCPHEYVQKT